MTEPMTAFSISAVLYQDGEWWMGQCLQYDITAQATSFGELQYELERVIFAHLCASAAEGRAPFEGLKAAPKKFWEMWEAGTGMDSRSAGDAMSDERKGDYKASISEYDSRIDDENARVNVELARLALSFRRSQRLMVVASVLMALNAMGFLFALIIGLVHR